jgi:hypothetical protein
MDEIDTGRFRVDISRLGVVWCAPKHAKGAFHRQLDVMRRVTMKRTYLIAAILGASVAAIATACSSNNNSPAPDAFVAPVPHDAPVVIVTTDAPAPHLDAGSGSDPGIGSDVTCFENTYTACTAAGGSQQTCLQTAATACLGGLLGSGAGSDVTCLETAYNGCVALGGTSTTCLETAATLCLGGGLGSGLGGLGSGLGGL